MGAPFDLGELLQRSREGDRDAYAEIIRLTSRSIEGVLTRLGLQPADRDDAAMIAYADAWERLDQVKSKEAFLGWLVRIAARTGWRVREHGRRRAERESSSQTEPESPPPPQDDAWVREMIAELPDDYQEVFDLRFLQGRRIDEIAEETHRKEHQINHILRRGLERLRRRLKGRWD